MWTYVARPKSTRLLTPLLVSVTVAIGIISAPAAGASPDRTQCSERGSANLCQRPGHSSLHAEPRGPDMMARGGQLFNPAYAPGFGRGMFPTFRY